jgi:hypothetical protein
VNAYHVLDQPSPTQPRGDYLLKQESASTHAKRLVHQLKQLGHKVTPADA